jgi:hypothetical protein
MQEADTDILTAQEDSQMAREDPKLPYWFDLQGDVV